MEFQHDTGIWTHRLSWQNAAGTVRAGVKVHFIGIGGTGMGATAGLAARAGHEVRGSDSAVYPPMSEQLAALGVPVMTPYATSNLDWQPDVVVVGNVHGKDHLEVAEAQRRGLPLTSFPALLGDQFLRDRHAVVISGTHGKTTTTALLGHILTEAGRDPGVFVGGVTVDPGDGTRLGAGREFVVEGDEYDTAFFDKGSKFFHYHPKTVVLTSVELDHVDIFSSFEAVRDAFSRMVKLIPASGLLLVCADSQAAVAVAGGAACNVEQYGVVDEDGGERPSHVRWWIDNVSYLKSGRVTFDVHRDGERLERFETLLSGRHNLSNVLAAVAAALSRGVALPLVMKGISSFAGVRRRQELRGVASGVTVIDDYAHHPTAVRETLKALHKRYARRRLVAVYDPRSATSRRRTFQHEFAQAFAHADEVVVGRLFDPSKIPEEERFDAERLALDLHRGGTPASYVPDVEAIVRHVAQSAGPGDIVCVLSSGSFDGIHDRLLEAIGDAIRPARLGDVAGLRALLHQAKLFDEEVSEASVASFFTLHNERGLVGTVALEVLGDDAILRALAVDPSSRGVGYGWMLADMALSHARFRGVRRIYLLTEHASDFFAAKLGFRVIDPSTVSARVSVSSAFSLSGDRNLVSMRLDV
jgi:UDP-N-acetylmuramate: L-alanyl-gamma-D-glutamyl-meso-diaminopimelate ligase